MSSILFALYYVYVQYMYCIYVDLYVPYIVYVEAYRGNIGAIDSAGRRTLYILYIK